MKHFLLDWAADNKYNFLQAFFLLVFVFACMWVAFTPKEISGQVSAEKYQRGETIPLLSVAVDSLGVAVVADTTWFKVYQLGDAAALDSGMMVTTSDVGIYRASHSVPLDASGAWYAVGGWEADNITDNRVIATWVIDSATGFAPGPYLRQVYARNVADTTEGLPYARFTAWDISRTTKIMEVPADANGFATMEIRPDSTILAAELYGWSVEAETVVVAGNGSDTLWADRWLGDITAPDPGLVQVVVQVRNPATGQPRSNVLVTAKLAMNSGQLVSESVSRSILTRGTYVDTTDTNGQSIFNVIPNENMDPNTTKYYWVINDNPVESFYKAVPDTNDTVYLHELP